jgi:hypothetical protein
VAVGLVFQADLMVGVGGDSLLAPAPDADEVGFWEISSHGSQAISPTTSRGDLKIGYGRDRGAAKIRTEAAISGSWSEFLLLG